MSDLTPKQIVAELDKHIIGQHAAKRAVAIALRNRWRRQQLDEVAHHRIDIATDLADLRELGRLDLDER